MKNASLIRLLSIGKWWFTQIRSKKNNKTYLEKKDNPDVLYSIINKQSLKPFQYPLHHEESNDKRRCMTENN
jgi:hypothetical protein